MKKASKKIMNFEFVEFYPFLYERTKKNKYIVGNVHIYVYNDQFQFDLKGIVVLLNKDKMYFFLPFSKGIDPETKVEIRFPVVNFTQEQVNKDFREFLSKNVEPIIRERLKKVD